MLSNIKASFCLLRSGNPYNKLVWRARNVSSICLLGPPRTDARKSTSTLGNYPYTQSVRNINMASLPELPYKVETASGELIMDWTHPKDADDIREYLLRNFFTATPIREVYLMDENDEAAKQSTWFTNLIRDYASQPYSVFVYKKTDNGDRQIVATALHKVEHKPNLCSQPPMKNVSDELLDQSFGWLRRAIQKELYRDLDLFDRYQTDKIFKSGLSSSRADLGQLGLFNTMLSVAMKRAYRDGVRVYQAEIYNTYAQRIAIKMGSEILRSLNVAEFECPAGVKPFANSKELLQKHPFFILVARKLPNELLN